MAGADLVFTSVRLLLGRGGVFVLDASQGFVSVLRQPARSLHPVSLGRSTTAWGWCHLFTTEKSSKCKGTALTLHLHKGQVSLCPSAHCPTDSAHSLGNWLVLQEDGKSGAHGSNPHLLTRVCWEGQLVGTFLIQKAEISTRQQSSMMKMPPGRELSGLSSSLVFAKVRRTYPSLSVAAWSGGCSMPGLSHRGVVTVRWKDRCGSPSMAGRTWPWRNPTQAVEMCNRKELLHAEASSWNLSRD